MARRRPCSTTLYLRVNAKSERECTLTGKCTHVGMLKMCIPIEHLKYCMLRSKRVMEFQHRKHEQCFSITTLKLNQSRGDWLPAPHNKVNKGDFTRSRQIIRYRAITTLRQLPQVRWKVTKLTGTSFNLIKVRSGAPNGRFGHYS